jgi:hypothetical protein
MRVGQLPDYSRFLDQPKLAILLPEVLRQDLLDFLDSYTIAVIVPRQEGLFEIVRGWKTGCGGQNGVERSDVRH